ncbi:hypothetical protein GOV12_05360 [Candidatus Pacearchaeota archaeon]|nr:hypothetical protein [Candidatus Pacearchaeota archaeon]
MAIISLVPNWFFGLDIIFELAFAIITFFLSLYAFKIYKLSDQKQSRLFGISFLLFSISYFIQSIINLSILTKFGENIHVLIKLKEISLLNYIGIYTHLIFFLIGLLTLTYMTFKIQNKKLYILLFLVSMLSLFLSMNKIYWFYFLASIFLIFIVIHYFNNYVRYKQVNNLLVLIAFIMLLFGHIHFIFSVNHAFFYVIGHFLELGAYILILISLLRMFRK